MVLINTNDKNCIIISINFIVEYIINIYIIYSFVYCVNQYEN